MKILDYLLFLENSENIQNIYHIIDFDKLKYIKEKNSLTPYRAGNGYVSFTRNKMMNSYLGAGVTSFIKLEINSNKLRTKYKIRPFSYVSNNGDHFNEYEERTKGSIKNIDKYINKIIINKDVIDNMLVKFGDNSESDWITDVPNRGGVKMPNMIKYILDNFDNSIIYVQKGSSIIKDDDYLIGLSNIKLKEIKFVYEIWHRGNKKSERFKYATEDVILDPSGNLYKNWYIGQTFTDIKGSEDKDSLTGENKEIDGVIYKPYLMKFRIVSDGYYLEDIRKL